ncbi:sulfite exporter TauE/SafE family protein [Noviherbaspirillum massiliense]|uniref:sulfite exporter TauE/SafE family protein n=1 Tax=Noviherbaspirillum massiliense TaxID=1465823 RepID=UPI00030B93D4|nr:sulfite exporter TauE/SafE family protein [Noviherbaspirillum massiliense]
MFGFESALVLSAVMGTLLLAGFVKGISGMGMQVVAMGVLSVVMPPAQAAAILVVPSTVTNLWQLFTGPAFGALVRRLWAMMVAICVGTWLGFGALAGSNAKLAAFILGAVLVLYALLGLVKVRFRVPPEKEWWLSPVIGFVTGLLTGATGVFAIPAVPYLNALGLGKDELVQSLGLSFTISTLALSLALFIQGAFGMQVAGASLLALLPAMLGMLAGEWMRVRVSEQGFRQLFLVGLLLLGAYTVIKNLPGHP